MEGCEDGFEFILRKTIDRRKAEGAQSFCYMEWGFAYGTTLGAVTDILIEAAAPMEWTAIGIDVPEFFALANHLAVYLHQPFSVLHDPQSEPILPPNSITAIIQPVQTFLTQHWSKPVDFALLDGCHGKACVMGDFKAVRPFLRTGSVLMFHDAAEEDQIGGWQPHCKEDIRVFSAMKELGLLSDHNPEWTPHVWLRGNKSVGANSFAVYVRK